ncbi:hypothetical protein PRIPAC_74522 [Pristionchus pacificus]|uniref:Uncharacterized protein n=1 Tax=Pristionchus pacificus TaxID=54126 RepID=A0A2A6C1G1_PRIPA|nr:hypothetical protein PRIPAC_74522 [Pristionchus pacificus]|eukprot:PDM71937.1 hypothetical protein PRIPAC_38344 [Pristionchus pacificus]
MGLRMSSSRVFLSSADSSSTEESPSNKVNSGSFSGLEMLRSLALLAAFSSCVLFAMPIETSEPSEDDCETGDLLGLCELDKELRRGLNAAETRLLEQYISNYTVTGVHDLSTVRHKSPFLTSKIEHFVRTGEGRVAAVGPEAREAIAQMQDYFRDSAAGLFNEEEDDAQWKAMLSRFAALSLEAKLKITLHFPKLARFLEFELSRK